MFHITVKHLTHLVLGWNGSSSWCSPTVSVFVLMERANHFQSVINGHLCHFIYLPHQFCYWNFPLALLRESDIITEKLRSMNNIDGQMKSSFSVETQNWPHCWQGYSFGLRVTKRKIFKSCQVLKVKSQFFLSYIVHTCPFYRAVALWALLLLVPNSSRSGSYAVIMFVCSNMFIKYLTFMSAAYTGSRLKRIYLPPSSANKCPCLLIPSNRHKRQLQSSIIMVLSQAVLRIFVKISIIKPRGVTSTVGVLCNREWSWKYVLYKIINSSVHCKNIKMSETCHIMLPVHLIQNRNGQQFSQHNDACFHSCHHAEQLACQKKDVS